MSLIKAGCWWRGTVGAGRNLDAFAGLWGMMVRGRETPKERARNFGLPVDSGIACFALVMPLCFF